MERDILVIVDKASAYGRQVLVGVGQYAQQHAWVVGVADVSAWEPRLSEWRAAVVQMSCGGIRDVFENSCRPVVNVADSERCQRFPLVRSDHVEIGRMAATHFLERGFRSLAFFGRDGFWYAQQRRDGFVEAAAAAGVQPLEFWWTKSDPTTELAQQRRWLESIPLPIGVMACDDPCAQRVAAMCRLFGRSCPEQVAVLGVDNDELICCLQPIPLSSVAVAGERVGYEAAALADRLLAGEAPPTRDVVVAPVGVVARRSTDVLAVADELVAQSMAFIRLHASEAINTQTLLAHLGVTRRQLEHRFHLAMRRSPAAELRRIRVEKAKQLLASTDVAIAAVAEQCGFCDGARLAKVFRRDVRMTPLEYRRRTRLR